MTEERGSSRCSMARMRARGRIDGARDVMVNHSYPSFISQHRTLYRNGDERETPEETSSTRIQPVQFGASSLLHPPYSYSHSYASPSSPEMRRNRHKHVRKALRFYKINHGFKVPFKVLVDGNFVNALLELKRGEVQDLVPQFLGEKCRVFTTRCCVNELKKLGLTDAARATRHLAIHHCGHDDGPSPSSECLLQQVSDGDNANHFFVATQDRALQRNVSNVPGGAVLFATVNGIQMEMPSEKQKQQMMKSVEARQVQMGEMERRMMDSGSAGSAGSGGHGGGGGLFRRKRAKGPNPLSIRKKKAGGEGSGRHQGRAEGAGEDKVKRKRQRRSREGGGGDEDAGK